MKTKAWGVATERLGYLTALQNLDEESSLRIAVADGNGNSASISLGDDLVADLGKWLVAWSLEHKEPS